jgi:hypothetical protein
LGKKWAVSVRAVPTDAYFHFDADASSTITLNGGDVSTIDNKGSAAANPTQGTASEQPLYDVGGMNGRSCLTFDEAENQDLVGSRQGSTSSSFTVFLVGKIDDEGTPSTYCRNTSSNKGWQIRKDSNENIQLRIGDGTMTQAISGQPAGGADNLTPSDISFDNDATKPFVACVRYDGTTMKMDFRNGETSYSLSKSHGNPGDIIYSTPTNTMFNEGDVDGYISVIASHNVAHDDDTMEENMNYLMRQFNIG